MTSTTPSKAKAAKAAQASKIKLTIKNGRLIYLSCKYFIFSALLVDMVVYFFNGTLNETLDSLGWLILLGVFEYESRSLHLDYTSPWEKWILMVIQTIGYGIAIKTTATYAIDHEWLDLTNAGLWLLVCCSIAYDIYVPGDFENAEWRIRNGIKMTLYMGLIACALTWAVEREWLDCLDATLWILCFGLVELNIFEFEESEETSPASV